MTKAKEALAKTRGSSLSIEERCSLSIELASWMLEEACQKRSRAERARMAELSRMMADPQGKAFTTMMTDQCFRSDNPQRVAKQLCYLLERFGIPRFLSFYKRLGMNAFRHLSPFLPRTLVPFAKQMVRHEMAHVILPGEEHLLRQHLSERRAQGVRINFNHLGEAILGEEEAKRRLNLYIDALQKEYIRYVSIKVSSICSQINLLAWDDTCHLIKKRLRKLYRAAMQHPIRSPSGQLIPKFVNLDMEEYRDLRLTMTIFQELLDEEEFSHFPAGLVLQAYLPDAFPIQQQITAWAKQRVARGASPIKLRIVKGANLAMEQVEASLHDWPQAPYTSKIDVDANYKRMLDYACQHAEAVHLGIGSHNLFDIAYGLLLREEYEVHSQVSFEMLEGMADHLRRVVQELSGEILLYCPAAREKEFQTAVAYLMRRLDENTAPQNFLRHSFGLSVGTAEWNAEASRFQEACSRIESVFQGPRRKQNRRENEKELPFEENFKNSADTDFSLPQNQQWAKQLLEEWHKSDHGLIPLGIDGEEIFTQETRNGYDPSRADKPLYTFSLANLEHVERALKCSELARSAWASRPVEERAAFLLRVAHGLRQKRKDLIGAMVADGGKIVSEADVEVSEAIDFAEFYARSLLDLHSLEGIEWVAKGTALVTPPWNFPCAIPIGGLLSALVAGNTVLFKPATPTVLIGWQLAQIIWEAGVPRDVFQFITCGHKEAEILLRDPRVSVVILTGGTSTAQRFLAARPDLDLMAETGGKNAIVVTSMADRDLAIKETIQSAFGHAGQKCSAASLLILEKEIYDDPHFLPQLADAAASLKVGASWDPATVMNPLIRPPDETLLRGLTELQPGEQWLLKPEQDPANPHQWSPGIKIGVEKGAFTHLTELFGPVLSVMRAENLAHAIELVNSVPYGLTSGLQSLDEREHVRWFEEVEAGNYYINRSITGAIVQRQPFGGCKASSFGSGAKAGGPNYLTQLMVAKETAPPSSSEEIPTYVEDLGSVLSAAERKLWELAVSSYVECWKKHFSQQHDPSRLLGQDNIFGYRPHTSYAFRVQVGDRPLDILKVLAAARICGTSLELSVAPGSLFPAGLGAQEESDEEFIQQLSRGNIRHLRVLQPPSEALLQLVMKGNLRVFSGPALSHGRLELLKYLRETSLSVNYHRYGNLGDREGEIRNYTEIAS